MKATRVCPRSYRPTVGLRVSLIVVTLIVALVPRPASAQPDQVASMLQNRTTELPSSGRDATQLPDGPCLLTLLCLSASGNAILTKGHQVVLGNLIAQNGYVNGEFIAANPRTDVGLWVIPGKGTFITGQVQIRARDSLY